MLTKTKFLATKKTTPNQNEMNRVKIEVILFDATLH